MVADGAGDATAALVRGDVDRRLVTIGTGYPGAGEVIEMCDRPAGQASQDVRAPANPQGEVLRVARSRALPDVVTVRAVGEADLATATRLHAAIVNAVEERPAAVWVDLSELTYCGSAGLAALVHGRRAAAAAGVGFTVVNLQPHVQRVIEVAGLRGFLAVRHRADEAL